MRASIALAFCLLLLTVGARVQSLNEPGLLFYLSGDHGLSTDYAAGGAVEPNFANDVRVVPDGAKGPGRSRSRSHRVPPPKST